MWLIWHCYDLWPAILQDMYDYTWVHSFHGSVIYIICVPFVTDYW